MHLPKQGQGQRHLSGDLLLSHGCYAESMLPAACGQVVGYTNGVSDIKDCALQVADPHAPGVAHGHSDNQDSQENVEDLMSQLNALSTR